MNMKVTDSNPRALPSLGQAEIRPGTAPSRPSDSQPVANATEQSEIKLAPATQSAFGSRTERVSELQRAVADGSYKPNSQLTSEKLVSGALSRPE